MEKHSVGEFWKVHTGKNATNKILLHIKMSQVAFFSPNIVVTTTGLFLL